MSVKMKRRRRHDRLKRILTHRREDMLFFTHGTFPASSRACGQCACGSRWFSRDPRGPGDDWYDAHAYCDMYDE